MHFVLFRFDFNFIKKFKKLYCNVKRPFHNSLPKSRACVHWILIGYYKTLCTLYYISLYCTALYCIVLYCTVLYCIVLYCTALYCIVLHCSVWKFIILYCTVLYCIVLHCTALYCIVL